MIQDKFSFGQFASCYSSYIPTGRIFKQKNIKDSELNNLIKGLTEEVKVLNDLISEYLIQTDINNATDLIDTWEKALGIPDSCFKQTTLLPLDQRRRQCLAKIYIDSCASMENYKTLAGILVPGVSIEIEYTGGPAFFFPLPFPINFSSGGEEENFIVRIHLSSFLNPHTFPLPFPIQFSSGEANIIQCIFNKIKPIHIRFVYIYDL